MGRRNNTKNKQMNLPKTKGQIFKRKNKNKFLFSKNNLASLPLKSPNENKEHQREKKQNDMDRR